MKIENSSSLLKICKNDIMGNMLFKTSGKYIRRYYLICIS
jgi:hypothetical protein